MKTQYYCLAGCAILFASALLVLQVIGGLEYTAGASPFTQASMVAAMVTVSLLPVFIGSVWQVNKLLAMCLFIGFVGFLAYSLPASIGRIGEVKEGKALAADDAAQLKAELASVRKTLRFAEPEAARECEGAPEQIVPPAWPECRRKRGTVKAVQMESTRLETALRTMGPARLGDTSSRTLAWALQLAGVSEETIRRGSGMALAIGLEVVIFSLFGAAAAVVRRGLETRPRHAMPSGVESAPQPHRPAQPPGNGGKRAFTRDEALDDLKVLLKVGQAIPSQDWLKERWRLRSKGTASKWLSHWERSGDLPGNRMIDGRCKTVVAA